MKNDAPASASKSTSIPEAKCQGDNLGSDPLPSQLELSNTRTGNAVLKSGALFISSKGIGWTSWKKRWFVLTKTSLVFFRTDPNAAPQKGGEVNLILGGIDLYNSGSVAAKQDKKLLTVLFPDGRAFTLKTETLKDLMEWKSALEEALSQAPSAAPATALNGVLNNKESGGTNEYSEQTKDKKPAKSLVVGRPILLALEETDGTPSFLEKALRFIETHGVKVEGILRQAADVEEVENRIREYENGKTEFTSEEDAHVISDCVKYFLRALPSSPVPASCCKALFEACRSDPNNRVNAMRIAVCETFPEPNRRLLQRILLMMKTVASLKASNRMSTSAVAACMAPLLLRPLLGGECEITSDFDVGGDGSVQLLQAAAAANHAQAIVVTLLEQYQTIFSEGSMSPGLYSDSEETESDDEVTEDDDFSDEDEQDETQGSEDYTDDDAQHSQSESDSSFENDRSPEGTGDSSSSSIVHEESEPENKLQPPYNYTKRNAPSNDVSKVIKNPPNMTAPSLISRKEAIHPLTANKPTEQRRTVWGRTSARKNLSMESIDFSSKELSITNLEAVKNELQNRLSDEIKRNTIMQSELDNQKRSFYDQRGFLQREVARLQEQVKKERQKNLTLKSGLSVLKGEQPISIITDEKLKKEIEEILETEEEISKLKDKAEDLRSQLNPLGRKDHRQKGGGDSSQQGKFPMQMKGSSKGVANAEAGSNSTSLALTKLTNTLNFLKERRSQHANELQFLEKTKTTLESTSENQTYADSDNKNQHRDDVGNPSDNRVKGSQRTKY